MRVTFVDYSREKQRKKKGEYRTASSNTRITETTTFLHNNGGKPRRQRFEQQNDNGLPQRRLEVSATLLHGGLDSPRQKKVAFFSWHTASHGDNYRLFLGHLDFASSAFGSPGRGGGGGCGCGSLSENDRLQCSREIEIALPECLQLFSFFDRAWLPGVMSDCLQSNFFTLGFRAGELCSGTIGGGRFPVEEGCQVMLPNRTKKEVVSKSRYSYVRQFWVNFELMCEHCEGRGALWWIRKGLR